MAYDIRDQKRLHRVAKTIGAHGDRLQFSVFLCDLDSIEYKRLQAKLSEVIHHDADSVLMLDLGETSSFSETQFDYLGPKPQMPRRTASIF